MKYLFHLYYKNNSKLKRNYEEKYFIKKLLNHEISTKLPTRTYSRQPRPRQPTEPESIHSVHSHL